MQKILIIAVSLFILPMILGCETLNQGVNKTRAPLKAVGKTAGTVLDASGSVTEGMVEGVSNTDDAENPFNR